MKQKNTIVTPIDLFESSNQIDHIRAGIVAWMINKHHAWEMRVPLGELLDIMNGMGTIEGHVDKVADEFVLKLSRLHTSETRTVDLKQANSTSLRIKNMID